jgi:hypothetical protein
MATQNAHGTKNGKKHVLRIAEHAVIVLQPYRHWTYVRHRNNRNGSRLPPARSVFAGAIEIDRSLDYSEWKDRAG